MAMVALRHSVVSLKWRRILIAGLLICGAIGFAVHYAASFNKQKVSVGTRIVYWRAALQIAAKHPLLGTGPGSFSVPYGQIKLPEDDFARLCHNDYLEQACDSGVPGFLAYSFMVFGYLWWLYRYRIKIIRGFWSESFAVSIGLMGLCLHGLVDYPLYIPALAWPMFFLIGLELNYGD